MERALAQARLAAAADEVPVGAVLTDEDGRIIAEAHNRTVSLSDPTAHAEILVIRKGAEKIGNYRLLNTRLYVTVEPCLMCMGAAVHARVGQVVFGARDLKWGAAGSLYDFSKDPRLNHRLTVIEGVLADEARDLMQGFFQARRKSSSSLLNGTVE